MAKITILFFFLTHTYLYLSAHQDLDTVKIKSAEAEKIFLDNNLSIIAERLHINQAEALVLQAKAWPNPTLSVDEVNFNRNETSENIAPLFGNFGRNQQFTLQLEQLILTAKKRKKNIQLEISNKNMASNAYIDLLQALKVEFRSALADLIYQQSLKEDLILQNKVLDKLLAAQSSQLKSGQISRADFLRIKALKISMNADLNEVISQINDKQASIKTLMAISPSIQLIIEGEDTPLDINRIQHLSVQKLLETVNNNAQIKLANSIKEIGIHQLAVEKAKQVPDIRLNINYDRAGSTMFNFFGAGISMDIPLFDRNKGNIKYATYEILKNDLQLQEMELKIKNQVIESYRNLQHMTQLYLQMDKDYINELQRVQAAAADNFIKRNLSLLEFLDLFNSFKESKQLYYQTIREIQVKIYELNYLTDKTL